jgi:hypothetical protein
MMINKKWQSLIEDDDWEEAITTNRRRWLEGRDDQWQKTIIKKMQWNFPKGDDEEDQHGHAPPIV